MSRWFSLSLGLDRTNWRRRAGWIAGGFAVLLACGVIRHYWQPGEVAARPPASEAEEPAPPTRAPAAAQHRLPDVVAVVNGARITLDQLGQHTMRYHGESVLEAMVNRRLVEARCQQLGITITNKEVEDEIQKIADRFRLPVDRWLKMLENERGIKPAQYRTEVIWSMLALRRLAAKQLTVTEKELKQAYEIEYGPAVKARIITSTNRQRLEQIRAQVVKQPEEFGNMAKEYSEDTYSASVKGMIQPIRLHVGDKNIERAAFALQPDEVSELVQVGNQYAILKCDGRLPDRYKQFPFDDDRVRGQLIDVMRDQKLRSAADGIFKELQQQAKVDIVYAKPEARDRYPGVAAFVDNSKITLRDLSETCVERHGDEMLLGLIDRTILEQACQKQNVHVTDRDMDEEIAQAAAAAGKVLDDGTPDVSAWLESVKKEQKLPLALYRQDVVWPSAALKKLTGAKIDVNEDDLAKGYEANYGERVRCRVIVLGAQRRAQEVWDMARRNPTVEYFGTLAEQYSVEGASRALRGEVPPIQKHGGRPLLEKEAFSLKPGELSGVVQVGDKFVIMLCEGRTKPTRVDFNKVKDLLYQEIHGKKLRAKMTEQFAKLQADAQVQNFLARSSGPEDEGDRILPTSATEPRRTTRQSVPARKSTPR